MSNVYFVSFYLLFLSVCSGEYAEWRTKSECPRLLPKIFTNYAPFGNLTHYLSYTAEPSVNNLKQCVADCCKLSQCNVAMMHNSTCYNVVCTNSKMCLPLYRPEFANNNPPSMVLVRPAEDDEEWRDILEAIENAE